ncbi:MAG: sugar ABC transporter ATP-binding protein [Mesorhizobium sp.]
MSTSTKVPVVELRQISKDFVGTPVLKDISLSFEAGEVHGLLGENGAGKSTLIKILTGVYGHSGGQIIVDGREVNIHSPQDARKLGLGAVYQDAELIPSFTVAENILLGNEPGTGTVNKGAVRREAARILEEIGLSLDPDRRASTLTAAEMQLVMLATLFHRKYRLIVLDEPTARLSAQEAALLFELIRSFQKQGIAIIYISHRLGEIRDLCDRATILRGGVISATLAQDEITEDRVTQLMVDRNRSELDIRNEGLAQETTRLEVVGLATSKLKPLDLKVRAGEIVGITGPIGAGMEEIERSIGGLVQHDGKIVIDGQEFSISTPIAARHAGIAVIPEDRRKQALFPAMSVAENVSMPVLGQLSKLGLILDRAKERYAKRVMDRLNVNPRQPEKQMRLLSGGNQQKAVIGKWLELKSRVYVFTEPTAGVDVGAIREIYEVILRMAREGAAVIVISSSIREILALSETIMVIYEGRQIFKADRSACDYDMLLGISMSGRTAAAAA